MEIAHSVKRPLTAFGFWLKLSAQIKVLGGRVAHAYKRLLLTLGHTNHVQTRLKPADQRLLSQQRSKVARLLFPNDGFGRLNNSAGLFVGVVRHEVAEQAISEQLGFSDVDQSPSRI